MTPTDRAELDAAIERLGEAYGIVAEAFNVAVTETRQILSTMIERLDELEFVPGEELETGITLWRGPAVGGLQGPITQPPHELFAIAPGLIPWRPAFSKTNPAENPAAIDALGGAVFIDLKPSEGPAASRAGSSKTHEVWLPFDKRHRNAGMEMQVKLVGPWSWPKTGKFAGMVGWDGNWANWPGGGRPTGVNSSLRLTMNAWDRKTARLGVYLYLSGSYDPDMVSGPKPNDIRNNGTIVEYLLHDYGQPKPDEWMHLRAEVEGDFLRCWVDDRQVLEVEGLPFFTGSEADTGWNLGYISTMFGSDSLEYMPLNAGRDGVVAYKGVEYYALG